MKINIQRKCKACKGAIDIDRNNVQGVVYYKSFYYHTNCFCELAERRSVLKNGKITEWKNALDHVEDFENEAKDILSAEPKVRPRRDTDDLNDYLIGQYNVTAIPSHFWIAVENLQKGFYRGKRCKKVSIDTLLAAWKWGQRKLDDVNKRNKMNHRGPKDDVQRISYDFAILVNKIPDYLAYKAKQEAAKEEVRTQSPRINYNNLQRTEVKQEGLGDISALLDEF